MIPGHPEHVSPAAVASADIAIAPGKAPHKTLQSVAAAWGIPEPDAPAGDTPAGEGLAWPPGSDLHRMRFRGLTSREERRRRARRHADRELPPNRSFYFQGPGGKLNLRAQNVRIFLQVADGVDEAAWRHHLENGDLAR